MQVVPPIFYPIGMFLALVTAFSFVFLSPPPARHEEIDTRTPPARIFRFLVLTICFSGLLAIGLFIPAYQYHRHYIDRTRAIETQVHPNTIQLGEER